MPKAQSASGGEYERCRRGRSRLSTHTSGTQGLFFSSSLWAKAAVSQPVPASRHVRSLPGRAGAPRPAAGGICCAIPQPAAINETSPPAAGRRAAWGCGGAAGSHPPPLSPTVQHCARPSRHVGSVSRRLRDAAGTATGARAAKNGLYGCTRLLAGKEAIRHNLVRTDPRGQLGPKSA